MTMVEMTAIIATGILCVLCIICIVAMLRNGRQTHENSKAIKDMEKSLSSFGDSIKEQTEQLIEHMEKQPGETNDRRLDLLEVEIKQLSRLKEEAAAATETLAAAEVTGDLEEFGEIEELDDEIELDDLFMQLNAMEAAEPQEVPPQIPAEPTPVPVEPVIQPVPATPVVQPMPVEPVVQPATVKPAAQSAPANPLPVAPDPAKEEPRKPSRYHQGYNIGRSGRKYTAEELNLLIRE